MTLVRGEVKMDITVDRGGKFVKLSIEDADGIVLSGELTVEQANTLGAALINAASTAKFNVKFAAANNRVDA